MRELAHLRAGQGPRGVVVLHGFLGSGRNVATLARQLAASDPALSVLAPDLRGHGASPPLPPGADLATLATDVLATAERAGIGHPLALIGHSLGGRVALRAAMLAPGTVAAAVLLDIAPGPVTVDGGTAQAMAALLRAPASAPSRDVFRSHLREAGLAPEIVEWLLLNLVAGDGGYRWGVDRATLAALRERTGREDLWAAIEGQRPYAVHCVRGAASPYVSDEDARRLEKAGCPVETIDDAGHFLHVERPASVLAAIARGLRSSPGPFPLP